MRSVIPPLMALALLALLLPAPVGSAVEEQPTPESNTLWAHNMEESGVQIISPLESDPRSVESSPSGTNSGAGTGTSTWVIPLDPVLAHTLILDPDQTIDIEVYVGSNTGAGSVEVETRLEHGGELLAQGDAEDATYVPAGTPATSYTGVSWELTPEFTRLEATQELVWTVEVTGIRSALFMGMTSGHGHSNIVLPIVETEDAPGSGIETVYNLHEEATLEIQEETEETRTRLNVHNWTQGPTGLQLAFTSQIENGTLKFTIKDADNETVELPGGLDEALTESLNIAGNLTGLAAGNWTIEILETDFVGSYHILGQKMQGEGQKEEDDGGTEKKTDGSGGTTESDGNTTSDSEESSFLPTPGVVLVLAVTALAVAALRRRR